MNNKKSKTFRLSPDACATLSTLAKQSGTSETAVIERLIINAENSKDTHTEIAELLLSALDQKYENTITGLRLATRSAEKNIYIVIEMLHSLIMNTIPRNDQMYFPTHRLDISLASKEKDYKRLTALQEMQSQIYKEAYRDISEYLSNMKQRKDNK